MPKIAIVGAGVAGAILAHLLQDRPGLEIVTYERVGPDDHSEAGTGLNVGPNALKALALASPSLERAVRAASFAWRRWTVALTDGSPLMDLDLADVADNTGIRIRWSDLYRVLRAAAKDSIRYGEIVAHAEVGPSKVALTIAKTADPHTQTYDTADLLVVAEGRYSALRDALFGAAKQRFVGAALFRTLCAAPEDLPCPIDDYGQWFSGPNRLLAFRVPGGAVYCAGSCPLPPGAPLHDEMKTAAYLRKLYAPREGALSSAAAFLVDNMARNVERLHWARLQEGPMVFEHPSGRVLALGDAAHPMVPTLGQGATQAVEDACVTGLAILQALEAGQPLASVPAEVGRLRRDRVRFCMNLSRQASDTMLAGGEPIAGARWKTEPDFRAKLAQLYRDVRLPGIAAPAKGARPRDVNALR